MIVILHKNSFMVGDCNPDFRANNPIFRPLLHVIAQNPLCKLYVHAFVLDQRQKSLTVSAMSRPPTLNGSPPIYILSLLAKFDNAAAYADFRADSAYSGPDSSMETG